VPSQARARGALGGVDARRDRQLQRLGYRVLRLPAELVRSQFEQALEQVRAALAASP
jgi:very-short-patch-repair endonuclease